MPQSGWMNGILELGTWEKASLQIQIESKEVVEKVFCALLPLQKFLLNNPKYYEIFSMRSHGASLSIKTGQTEAENYL